MLVLTLWGGGGGGGGGAYSNTCSHQTWYNASSVYDLFILTCFMLSEKLYPWPWSQSCFSSLKHLMSYCSF